MGKMFKWISGFFEEESDTASATRLIMIGVTFAVLGVWAALSIYKLELLDIPTGLLIILGGVWGLKVGQKSLEVSREKAEIKQGMEQPQT